MAEPLGHQTLDGLAQELFASIAEQPLDLVIDEGDRAGAIDHHHPAGRRLHHGAEAGVRLPVRGQPAFEPHPGLAAHAPRTDRTRRDECQREGTHPPDEAPHWGEDTVAWQFRHQDPRRAADHLRASEGGPAARSRVLDDTRASSHVHRRSAHARR